MFDLFLELRQLLLEEWRGTIPIAHCEYCCGQSLLVPEGLLGILCPSHTLEAVMCSQQQLSDHRKRNNSPQVLSLLPSNWMDRSP